MIVESIFALEDGIRVVTGSSVWEDNVTHKAGDVLCSVATGKKWKVTAVDLIFQGCFVTPKERFHALKIKPVDGHSEYPVKGDRLVK